MQRVDAPTSPGRLVAQVGRDNRRRGRLGLVKDIKGQELGESSTLQVCSTRAFGRWKLRTSGKRQKPAGKDRKAQVHGKSTRKGRPTLIENAASRQVCARRKAGQGNAALPMAFAGLY
jgi:hypothetical protein